MTETSSSRANRHPVRWRDAYLDFSRVGDGRVFLQRVDADGAEWWEDDDPSNLEGRSITVGDDDGNTALALITESSGGSGWWISVDMDTFDPASNHPPLHYMDNPRLTAAEQYAAFREEFGPGERGRAAHVRAIIISRAAAQKATIKPVVVQTDGQRRCVRCVDDYAEPARLLCRMCQFEHDRQVTR